jgi:hypothetical protein
MTAMSLLNNSPAIDALSIKAGSAVCYRFFDD